MPARSDGRYRRGRRQSRVTALVVAVALVLTASACQYKHTTVFVDRLNNADAAAAWLEADAAVSSGTYTAGMEADLIFALAATYGDEGVARAALARLETKTPTYAFPTPTFTNYGALAKVMLAVQVLRGDVNDFAGRDLEATLRAGMLTSGADAGRFTNTTTFTQPLAISALARTADGVPAAAGEWLVSKQCPDGGFSWGACSQADADYTAVAVQALHAVDQPAALDAGVGWLLANQRDDGGFHASNAPTVSNTNSTGLAVAALRGGPTSSHGAGEVVAAAVEGSDYVASVQYTSGPDAGAIPWQADVPSSIFMATTQGVLGWGSGPIQHLAFPQVIGSACPDETGVTVVVDLSWFNNTIKVACAEGPQANGWAALETAGFTLGSVPGFEGEAICTIDGQPAAGYPTCWYEGFWSYWHTSETDPDEWELSNWGAANRTPPEGSFEGWRYEPDLYNHWADAPRIAPVR